MIVYSGYPVGCAIPNVHCTAASSPESICTTEGAIVNIYTIDIISPVMM